MIKKLILLLFLISTLQSIEKKFSIIIPSYNVDKICNKIIHSISSQNYKNYEVYFIDDGSTDLTYFKAKNYLKTLPDELRSKFHIKHYKNHKGPVERLYKTIRGLNDDDIVIYFEGNTWLEKRALVKFNNAYQKNNSWLVYGQDLEIFTNKKGRCKKLSSKNLFTNSMRGKNWKRCKIKSFYAKLFKKIKLEDFFFRGDFVNENFDSAYMFPMMEMAHKHAFFIKKIVCNHIQDYEYRNSSRACNKSPFRCNSYIKNASPYKKIKSLFTDRKGKENNVDLIIFSYHRPIQLLALLESLYKYEHDFNKISVIYRSDTHPFNCAYNDVKRNFPKVQFIKQSSNPHCDFKPLLLKNLKNNSKYVAFAVDDIIIKNNLNIKKCLNALDKSRAYFFSLRLGKNINYCYMGGFKQKVPNYISLNDEIIGWQIDSAKGDWTYYNSLDMTIYKKRKTLKDLQMIHFKHPNDLEINWNAFHDKHKNFRTKKKTGLSFKTSKCLNIPVNIVNISDNRNMNLMSPNDLLRKYNDGYKIDISKYFKFKNVSVHEEISLHFTKRK